MDKKTRDFWETTKTKIKLKKEGLKILSIFLNVFVALLNFVVLGLLITIIVFLLGEKTTKQFTLFVLIIIAVVLSVIVAISSFVIAFLKNREKRLLYDTICEEIEFTKLRIKNNEEFKQEDFENKIKEILEKKQKDKSKESLKTLFKKAFFEEQVKWK